MDSLTKQYEQALTLSDWSDLNTPDKDLIYNSGIGSQRKTMSGVSLVLGLDQPRVISYHASKSVKLPVSAYRFFKEPHGKEPVELIAVVRDNFYDLNCLISSSHELNFDYSIVYPELSHQELVEKFAKAVSYNPKYASDYSSSRDLTWYKDYTGNALIEENGKLYIAYHCHAEGIRKLFDDEYYNFKSYTKGIKQFIFSPSGYAHLAHSIDIIIKHIMESIYSEDK